MNTDTVREYEIRDIDAWRYDGNWMWNSSIRTGEIKIADSVADSPRKLLATLRDESILSEDSKGRVSIEEDHSGVIEIRNKNTYEPIIALMTR